MTASLFSGKYRSVTFFARKTGTQPGYIRIAETGAECTFRYAQCSHFTVPLCDETWYQIEFDHVEIVYAYLHEDRNGDPYIAFLQEDGDAFRSYELEALSDCIDQPMRCRYHFTPIRGWLNDPNGLCRFQGLYHMFYQFNPADQVWGNMHWGHAVSRDLLHWKHLPVALYPQPELMNLPELRGGAYSGTAIVDDQQLQLFYTRHIGDHARSWCQEWTVTCASRDGIHFDGERACVRDLPRELGCDFRDPKVLRYGGEWIMLTGTRTDDMPAVSIHCSDDRETWHYRGLFYVEKDERYIQAECPDFIQVDGKDVLLVGYHNRPGSGQIRRDVVYYIGHVEKYRFICETKGLLDWGKDFYAVQIFGNVSPPVLLGWNSDQCRSHVPEKDGANGSISLPRSLHIHGNELFSRPVDALRGLESEILCCTGRTGFTCLTEGSYHLHLEWTADSVFQVVLVRSDRGVVEMACRNGRLSVSVYGDKFCFDILAENLDAYVDRSLAEIFVNHGQRAFTRRFYGNGINYTVQFHGSQPLRQGTVTEVGSIWT